MRNFAITAACIGLHVALYAAPVGNPSFPQLLQEGYWIPLNSCINLRLGYEGDFISDALMKQTIEGKGHIDRYRQDTNSGVATINVFDRIDLYGVLGAARMYADWRFEDSDEMVNRIELETCYHFLWAVGGRVIIIKWGETIFGLGGRYNATDTSPTWVSFNGNPIPTDHTHLDWTEWQIDFDVSHQIDLFVPYIGVKYSSARAETGEFLIDIAQNGSQSLHMKNRTPVGLVIGCTLTTDKYFMLNVEGRLIDEMAATISGDFRF